MYIAVVEATLQTFLISEADKTKVPCIGCISSRLRDSANLRTGSLVWPRPDLTQWRR